MTTAHIAAAEFPAFIARMVQADEVALRRAALEACQRGVGRAVHATEAAKIDDQRLFRLAWKAVETPTGAALRNDAPHAGIVELGRRPNRPGPPLEPILEWVQRKLFRHGGLRKQWRAELAVAKAFEGVAPRRKRRGGKPRQRRRQAELFDRRIQAIARAIRLRIHQRGTRPRLILRGLMPALGRDFVEAAGRHMRRRHPAGAR